mgnify:FL=1|tara:strand:- start:2189 stop:3049 length:861 start_codon:yes stop_codon:yes gene_type:complete
MAGNISISTDNSANHIFDNSDNTILLNSLYGDYQNIVIKQNSEWFEQIEYIIFRNEMKSIKKNYLVVLKECKENKRLLDLKYDDLNTIVNNIQTSVIFFSTFSGFLQATRIQFNISDTIISIISITISTYISLLLSISKYYKLDEMKEKIQVLREKFSLLHNKLDYQMDILGPWLNKHVWIHQDSKKKLVEWAELHTQLKEEYDGIIETKKDLVTEFEIIMDTKSRNSYFIKNRELNYKNRIKLNEWDKKESDLEASIQNTEISRPSISLKHEELDNWDDDMSDSD